MATAYWHGEFHLIKGTLFAGTQENYLSSLSCYKEAHYSNPNYSMLRSRASFYSYANEIIFGNGNKSDDPALSFFDNSRTHLFQLDPAKVVAFDGSIVHLEDQSQFTVSAKGYCTFTDNDVIAIINNSKLSISTDQIRIPDAFTFSLGGFKNENGDGNVDASIAFVGRAEANNPFNFMRNSYPEGIFNFVTIDNKGKPITNKGTFVFSGQNMGNIFQKQAMIDKKLISIDGIAVTDESLIADDWDNDSLYIHLK